MKIFIRTRDSTQVTTEQQKDVILEIQVATNSQKQLNMEQARTVLEGVESCVSFLACHYHCLPNCNTRKKMSSLLGEVGQHYEDNTLS